MAAIITLAPTLGAVYTQDKDRNDAIVHEGVTQSLAQLGSDIVKLDWANAYVRAQANKEESLKAA